jgi:histone H2B
VHENINFKLICISFQVSIDIPFAFRAIPAEAIESTGAQILKQILGQILPRFMAQV